jgi:hypothetical protein
MSDAPECCARCGRPVPSDDDDAQLDWEATADGCAWICPHCLTRGEQHAIDEADMNLCDEIEMGRAVDEVFGVDDD